MSPLDLTPPPTPEQLRPLLHQRIDEMNETQLATLHTLILEARLQEVLDELGDAFDRDATEGRLDEGAVAETIRRVRERRRARAGA